MASKDSSLSKSPADGSVGKNFRSEQLAREIRKLAKETARFMGKLVP